MSYNYIEINPLLDKGSSEEIAVLVIFKVPYKLCQSFHDALTILSTK